MTKEYNVELVKDGKVVATAKGVSLSPNIIEKEAQNMPLEIGFKRLSDNAILPTKAHSNDSGYDICAAEDVIIPPGHTVVVKTDLSIVLPEGYDAYIKNRSGVSSKTKLRVVSPPIDEGYRGAVGIIIDNIATTSFMNDPKNDTPYVKLVDGKSLLTKEWRKEYTYLIRKGDRLAQLTVQPRPNTVAVEITGELEDSDRGANGFGSSGV